jgi:hypothetical protein
MPTPNYDGAMFDQPQSEDDKRLYVQFFMEAVKNETKSAAEGRPIFDEKPLIRIFTPGSRDVMVTRATPQYQARFAAQWAKFQQSQEQAVDGTPLEQVPFLTVGQVAELKAINCITLEQLAGMADSLAQKFMGSHQLRQRAKDFLEVAKSAAPMTQLRAELEERDNKISVLERQVAELVAASKKVTQAATTKG